MRTLARGKEELEGAPISLVLLSGGSANIGWLRELIQEEFAVDQLEGVEILPLPDYQEVVAKGSLWSAPEGSTIRLETSPR